MLFVPFAAVFARPRLGEFSFFLMISTACSNVNFKKSWAFGMETKLSPFLISQPNVPNQQTKRRLFQDEPPMPLVNPSKTWPFQKRHRLRRYTRLQTNAFWLDLFDFFRFACFGVFLNRRRRLLGSSHCR